MVRFKLLKPLLEKAYEIFERNMETCHSASILLPTQELGWIQPTEQESLVSTWGYCVI